ncbi:MAG: hypothetical protein ACLFWF_07540, partial [Alphaproteobacteria bacterium]
MFRLALSLMLIADIASASEVSLTVDPEPGDAGLLRSQFEQIMREPGKEFDGGLRDQAFSILGREDLIAQQSRSYAAQTCEPGATAADPLTAIVSAARRHRVVIINEAHDWSAHRAFIEDVASALAKEGFSTYAAETFQFEPGREPRPYLRNEEGYYSREATYGRLARTVLALGYKLVPYEQKLIFASEEEKAAYRELPSSKRIARREEEQANNLIARFFDRNKKAKILIHVGYSHAREVPQTRKDGKTTLVWMAARLKQKTGIDPLTIDQTFCRGSSGKIRLGAEPQRPQLPPGSFDLYVDHPLPEFEH